MYWANILELRKTDLEYETYIMKKISKKLNNLIKYINKIQK